MTKKETFKWIVQIIASIATAILTAMATGAVICDKALMRRRIVSQSSLTKKKSEPRGPLSIFVAMTIVD